MSWLSRLFFGSSGCGCGPKSSGRPPEQRVYLVDASGLVEARQRNGTAGPNPRDHFNILKNLATLANREQIRMIAVFTGRPLREAADGASFKDVQVFYSESLEGVRKKLVDLTRQNASGKDVLVLTADEATEKEVGSAGATCMRLSTLKKAFDERDERGGERGERGGERGGVRGERGGGERGDRNGRNRRPQQGGGRPNNNDRPTVPAQPETVEDDSLADEPELDDRGKPVVREIRDDRPQKSGKDASVLDLIDPL